MSLRWTDSPDPDRLGALLAAVRAADGQPDGTGTELLREYQGGEHLELLAGDTLVGYAHVAPDGDAFGNAVVELLVHPEHRRAGHGGELVSAVLEHIDGPARFWSHANHPAAAALATRFGLRKVRELLKMRAEVQDWPEPKWPEGVHVRTFRPGADEAGMVAVNARAFDWHPEQGRLTVSDVVATEREAWFDPEGFFLAVDDQDEPVGFHWTKIHPDGVGEVYVVGVDPAAQGGGLGRALTAVGLRHLRAAGAPAVILYVESDNKAALRLYRALGFVEESVGVQYATSG
ncbi:mycothiol synthase [Labedaea rhizosphaerae]|uniref:Mycothiol acetyltransferase n=1 Tax=Labedaea rhizosphaerae TaxID=598644 RepID=A0A4R6SN31_LABRH|nr:mycothiol synthase [Labedaea rhizosphaerae]TDQ05437.1 mycothiol synthase [Labedaea rhizosphaerae]